MSLSVSFFLLAWVFAFVLSYKPVVIVHGIWDLPTSLDFMADRIQQAHPGTNVSIVNIYHARESLLPMWTQVEGFGRVLQDIMQESPDGIHLIGYSQGGLICRGIVESFTGHNIHTFISLSSPQAGQYGDNFLHLLFPNFVKSKVYRLFYTSLGQKYSIANYWNDPHHQALYKNRSVYLPYLNNEIVSTKSAQFRSNFLKLRNLVLIGGPDDGVITPWESSHFGYFDHNETVIHWRHRKIYRQDLFGLKTLDKRKAVHVFSYPNVHHNEWHHTIPVIDQFILPFLT